ncbi:MAG: hypothetical protein KAJ19_26205, partial [Gammaproteobacteria bacterium]|nr:hypothetical protein [Gammaproteobacteria bacterium]
MTGAIINATSLSDFHDKRQALTKAFDSRTTGINSKARPRTLRYTGATVVKELTVVYDTGFELGIQTPYLENNIPLRVIANDPHWRQIGESAVALDTNDAPTMETVIAKVDNLWTVLGPPNAAGTYTGAWTIISDDKYVYVGGNFTNFDNIAAADYIVRYEKAASTWSAMDSGLNGQVRDFALGADGTLYVVGDFTNASADADADYIAQWNGTAFSAVGVPDAGAASITNVKAVHLAQDGKLYLGGLFDNFGDVAAADNVCYWDGSAYQGMDSGVSSIVNSIHSQKSDEIYIGGDFVTAGAGATTVNDIVKWDGSAYSALSGGTDGATIVYAVHVARDGNVYMFGSFATVDSVAGTARAAMWNGTAWTPLSTGFDNTAFDVSESPNGDLYICGFFTTAGGKAFPDGYVIWNGSSFIQSDLGLSAADCNTIHIDKDSDLWVGANSPATVQHGGNAAISYVGTKNAYPRIAIKRSGGTTAIIHTIINTTTGAQLLFNNYALLDGETITIDLRPGQRSIISDVFGLRWDALLPTSDTAQFYLESGNAATGNTNNIRAYIAVVGGPTITANMIWKDAYSGVD